MKPSKLARKAKRKALYEAYLKELKDKRVVLPCNEGRWCTKEAVYFAGWRFWCEEHPPNQ